MYMKKTNFYFNLKLIKNQLSEKTKLLSFLFLLFISTFNLYSQNTNVIVGWNYGNGKVMYCGMGYMMNPAAYHGDFFQHSAERQLFVNMVRKTSSVANPVVGIFAVTSLYGYSNIEDADILISILALNGITGVKVTAAMIDTQAEIDNYDVLILGGSGMYTGESDAGYAGVQSVIKNFVQNNQGGVIFAGWSVFTINGMGLVDYADMIPVYTSSGYSYADGYSLVKVLPADDLYTGIGSVASTGFCEYPTAGVKPGATVYGTISTYVPSATPADPTSISVSVNPICNGSGTQLTANGADGTVYWYTSSCGGTQFTTGNPITVNPAVSTTYYAKNYNNSAYSNGCASVTITVNNNFTSGAISTTGQTICYNTAPTVTIGNATDAVGGDNNISYTWRSSADNYATAISGATSSTYLPTAALTATTSYRRYAKDNTCNTTPEVSAGTWTVSVSPAFTSGTIANTGETICYNGDPSSIGSTTDASGGNTVITYQWQSSTDAAFTSPTTISSNTATYDPPTGLTVTTWYRRQAKDGVCNTSWNNSAEVWKVTVRPAFTSGSIATTGQTICYNTAPTVTIGNATDAEGGDNTISYTWRTSTDNYATAISGATSSTYLPTAALTTTTSYRRYAKDNTCNSTPEVSAGTWTVTVYDQVVAGIAGPTTGCVSVSLTATGGGTYSWSGGSTPSTSANTFTTGGTYTVSVTVSVNGCEASTSQEITVTPQPGAPSNTTPLANLTINSGNNTLLSTGGSGQPGEQLGWYDAPTAGNFLGMGSTYTTNILDNTTTFYVQSLTCIASPRTAIIVTVNQVTYNQAINFTLEANEASIAPPSLSCPWVYTWDGSSYVKDNDIYSVARYPFGEYRDSYTLRKPLVSDNGKYKLQINEIATEESYTDYVNLVAVDHAADVKIAPDNKGHIFAYKPANLITPITAVSNTGANVLSLINQDNNQGFDAYSQDYIDINFGNINVSNGARMVLKAKGFNEGVGTPKPFIGAPAIVVQININGIWTEIGRLRPRFDWDVCAFDISSYSLNPANGIKVRLYSISHDLKYTIIDYVGLETGTEPAKTISNLPLSNATFSGNNVVNTLSTADNQYVHMSPNNQMNIEFNAPAQSLPQRSFVFVSEGFYIPLTNTYYIYTWNGSSWVSRFSYTFATTDETKTFNVSAFLPDPNNEMKVRVYQDYSGSTAAAIDLVKIQINSINGVLTSAKDLRNQQSVLSYVNASDDSRFTLGSGFGYTGGADRWSEYNFIPADPTSVTATINPICYGTSTQLTALGTQGEVKWFTASCGGTLVGTGNPITVAPTSTTTYYAKNYMGGVYSAGCASITVTVTPITAINSQSTNAQSQCINGAFTPISVDATGTGTITYQWYSNTNPVNSGGISLGSSNGAQTNAYTPRATTAGTLYYYCVIHSDCGTDVNTTISGAFIVYPYSVGGTITGTSTINYGLSTGTFTLGSYVGTIQRWEKKFNSGSWTTINNTNATYSEIPNAAGTWYYRVAVKSGDCDETYSNIFSLTVNPIPLSITANNKVKTYDGLIYSPFTVSYNGFVLSDSYLSLGGSLSFSGTATTATEVGTYIITPGGFTSTNYIISYSNGSLTINCSPVVNVFNNNNSGYGSLRNAMANLCSNGTITFNSINNQTINLTSGTLAVDKNITFNNSNHTNGITIAGSGTNLTINTGKVLTLASNSKITVSGTIVNNGGTAGLVIESGASFIHNTVDLQATTKRYLNNDWHLIGSPFKKTLYTVSNIAPIGGSLQIKPYTNGTNWQLNVTSMYTYLLPTTGYAVKPTANYTMTLAGNLYYSALSFDNTVALTYNGTSATQSWNLLANPYTSNIDFKTLTKTNISQSLYIWDNTRYPNITPVTNTTYFNTYNTLTNVGVPVGTTSIIAPMQGFFVKATYTSPKIVFTSAARTHSNAVFYKSNDTEILLRLKAESEQGADELAICKNESAKQSFEEYDSEKLLNANPLEMYSYAKTGEKLTINTANANKEIIPLGINAEAGSKVKIISFGMESAENLYLEDRIKGKLISLSENTEYTFVADEKSEYGRFFIRFGNTNSGLISSDISVTQSGNNLSIIAQTGESIEQIEIFTITGASVYSAKGSTNVHAVNLNLSKAIYLIRVKTSIETQNLKFNWK